MIDEFWKYHTVEINNFIANSCLSIYGATHDDLAVHSGSCCLISYKEYYFLVTANHLIKEHKNKPLYVQYTGSLFQVGGEFVSVKDVLHDKNIIDADLSFIQISNFSFFSKNDFLPIHDCFLSKDNAKTLCGFPNSKNKLIKITKSLKHEIYIYTGLAKLEKFFTKIGHQKDKIINDDGKKVNPIALRGISGGCLIGWELINNYLWFKLEGIIIEIDKSSNVICTNNFLLKTFIDKYIASSLKGEAVITKIF